MLLIIKDYIREIIIIICLFIIFLMFKCDKKKNIETIIIPAKQGKIIKENKIEYLPSKPQVLKNLAKEIKTENPVNKKLLEDLILAQRKGDSLEVLKKYVKAIEEKEEIRTFIDTNLEVEVYSKVRGEILEQRIEKYKIPKQKVAIAIEKDQVQTVISVGVLKNLEPESKTLSYEIGLGVRLDKTIFLVKGATNKYVGLTIIKEL